MIEVLTAIVLLVITFIIGGLIPRLVAALIFWAVDLYDVIAAAWIRRKSLRDHFRRIGVVSPNHPRPTPPRET